jgi:hypothetical protein
MQVEQMQSVCNIGLEILLDSQQALRRLAATPGFVLGCK